MEQLLDDVDLNVRVTRQEFEELCADLFERVPGPLRQVAELSGIPLVRPGGSTGWEVGRYCRYIDGHHDSSSPGMAAAQDDVAAVVLMGGGLRIPRVQAVLKETLGRYGPAAQPRASWLLAHV